MRWCRVPKWLGNAGAEQRSDAACIHVAQMEDMAMRNFDFTPLWRSTVAFDHLEDAMLRRLNKRRQTRLEALDDRHAERTPGLANGSKAPLSWTSVTLPNLSARSGRRGAGLRSNRSNTTPGHDWPGIRKGD
jgi:hypothetical protein